MVVNPTPVTPQPGEGVNDPPTEEVKPEQLVLNSINEATGRNYPTLEEAKKGLKETYGFVGDEVIAELRRKAQEFDKLKARPLQGTEKSEEFYKKVDKMEFLLKFPDARPYADMIGAIARDKGVSWFEAYETTESGKKIQKIVEKDVEERKAAEPSFVTGGGARLAPSQQLTGMSTEEFSKLPLEEQKKIIEKLPIWSEKIPKGTFRSKKTTG